MKFGNIWECIFRNENDFNNYIVNTLKSKKAGQCYPFLIIDKTTNKIAGSSRYGYLNEESQKCEIGWTWLGKDFQGSHKISGD